MTDMRAKMRISHIETYEGQETLHFSAVCASTFGEDGSDENNTFAKYTPSAEFKMTIANPALLGKFTQGDEYYCDFTKAN